MGALLGEPGSIGVLGSLLATSVRPPRAAVYPLRALLPVFVGLVAAFAVVLPSSGLAGSRVARDTAYAALGILAVGCVWLADRIAVSRAVAGLRRSRTVLHWIFLGAGIAIAGAVVGTTLGFGVGLAAYMAYALAARGAGAESLIVGENGIAVIGLMIYAGFFGTSSALAVLPLLRRDRDRRISGSESDGGATRRQEIP
ncbi:MAG TPA: hypothetical protein ENK55_06815 [Actinobacteria bacterium]|nr:hypothetical protein [Actinomycetota bacterium]